MNIFLCPAVWSESTSPGDESRVADTIVHEISHFHHDDDAGEAGADLLDPPMAPESHGDLKQKAMLSPSTNQFDPYA